MSDLGTSRFAVVIPAYNEAATIRDVVGRALSQRVRVIVVDDGSQDGTSEALGNLPVTVLRNPRNLGKGASLQRGMELALQEGMTAVMTLDGDGQHEPEDIPSVIAAHRRDPRAIVIGSRLHDRHKIPRARYYANRVANFGISWAAGQCIPDSQSGFRLYPTEVICAIGMTRKRAAGFVLESEVLIEAARRGIMIRSVPVAAIYGRHLRRSHFRQIKDIALIVRMVVWKLLSRGLYLSGLMRSLSGSHRPERRRVSWLCSASTTSTLSQSRPRVLFIAESVTLAHVARPFVLARALDPSRYDIHFASAPRYGELFGEWPFALHPIRSIQSEQFRNALARGKPLYDVETLRSYVREDLELIDAISPHVIIGDFRLSLSISARVAAIPYLAITNAHWSPYARPRFLVPDLPVLRKVGTPMGQFVFSLLRPLIFAHQSLPVNRVRREYGLPSVGHSLSRIFTDADETLYADLPELVSTFDRPPSHRYLGPILWSPGMMPPWWEALPEDEPTVYVSFGTSGRSDLLPLVLEALAGSGIHVLAATVGRNDLPPIHDRVWVADYLPGLEAAKRSALVICNGGSAGVYQALAAGVPVLGIPSNLDQYLTMWYVSEAGAGELIRAGEATAALIKQTIGQILRSSSYRCRAEWFKVCIDTRRTAERFDQVLSELLADRFPLSTASTTVTVGTRHMRNGH